MLQEPPFRVVAIDEFRFRPSHVRAPTELIEVIGHAAQRCRLVVVCALVAVAFIKGLLFVRSGWKRLWGFRGVVATGLGGLFVGVIGIWVPEVFAVGYPAVSKALTHSYALPFLLCLLVLKFIATAKSHPAAPAMASPVNDSVAFSAKPSPHPPRPSAPPTVPAPTP